MINTALFLTSVSLIIFCAIKSYIALWRDERKRTRWILPIHIIGISYLGILVLTHLVGM